MQSQGNVSCKPILAAVATFLALSVADLLLTRQLVELNVGEVVENNPLAGFILESHGWMGLAAFKFSLMGVIGALILCIFQRRPRSAELVTIFGCGAQAAIVLTSFFHLYNQEPIGPDPDAIPGSTENNGILPPASMTLLVQASVQSELQLSDTQMDALRELVALRRQLRTHARAAELNEWHGDFHMLSIRERRFVAEMTAAQLQRLKQLAWQYRGPLAFADVDVAQALRLSYQQVEDITNVLNRVPPADNHRQESEALKHQLAVLLCSDQHGRWQSMLGTPFKFDPPTTSEVLASSPSEEDDTP